MEFNPLTVPLALFFLVCGKFFIYKKIDEYFRLYQYAYTAAQFISKLRFRFGLIVQALKLLGKQLLFPQVKFHVLPEPWLYLQ